MRRMLMCAGSAMVFLLTACSGDLDPIVGWWTDYGPHPDGYYPIANIRVDTNGTASVKPPAETACGGAKVKVNKVSDNEASYTIAFPGPVLSWCAGKDVPQSMDVTVSGDTLKATFAGMRPPRTLEFKRTSPDDVRP